MEYVNLFATLVAKHLLGRRLAPICPRPSMSRPDSARGNAVNPTVQCPSPYPGASLATGRHRSGQEQSPLQGEFWTNEIVTELCASTTALSAFLSGQRNRWLAAKTSGEYAGTGLPGSVGIRLFLPLLGRNTPASKMNSVTRLLPAAHNEQMLNVNYAREHLLSRSPECTNVRDLQF